MYFLNIEKVSLLYQLVFIVFDCLYSVIVLNFSCVKKGHIN